jgi:hypothetical protein
MLFRCQAIAQTVFSLMAWRLLTIQNDISEREVSMSTRMRRIVTGAAMTTAAVIALGMTEAQATTFDISTLNTSTYRIRGFTYYNPAYQGSVEIISASGYQVNPWTQGADGGAATLELSGFGGQGNNGSKIYYTAGGNFPIPAGQTLGANMNGYSGDYATGSFPLYFDFSDPTGTTAAAVTLNSLYISSAPSTGFTILGYSDLGHTLVDTYTTTANLGISPTQVTLDWTGIEYVDIVASTPGTCWAGYACASGFYVNDIEVNDPLPAVPEPMTISLLETGLIGLGIAVRRRRA